MTLEQFQEKWKPGFRPELRQNKRRDGTFGRSGLACYGFTGYMGAFRAAVAIVEEVRTGRKRR
jgi:hypothetical protein